MAFTHIQINWTKNFRNKKDRNKLIAKLLKICILNYKLQIWIYKAIETNIISILN
jgi:hypothetical protein